MGVGLLIILALGTVLMMAVMFICHRWRPYAMWKLPCLSLLLTVAGVVGVKLMFFIESGTWGGMSFFGAILFVPVLFIVVRLLFHIPYGELMDLCAPAECIMLALMKVNCFFEGCCVGRVVSVDVSGAEIRFPSQIVEFVFAFAIMVTLIVLMRKKGSAGKIYPFYMIFYGTSRFVLNLLRETSPFIWILPAGNFWSLISIVVGVVWLCVLKKSRERINFEV